MTTFAHDDSPRAPTPDDVMKAGEVAALFAVPVSTALHWGRTGVLQRIKLGRHVRSSALTSSVSCASRTMTSTEGSGPAPPQCDPAEVRTCGARRARSLLTERATSSATTQTT